jgi:RimJ/RimL family protein N-acetyltransferase
MTLAHGTDRLGSARLVLRRIAPDDLPFFTRIHALPEVAQHLYPGGRPRSPEETAAWLQYTLASYEQLALGYLAVLRKEDGALIGRCGLMDLVVESAAPGRGIRRGWFGREQAPAGVALTFECELGYTLDPAVWGQGFATEAARCVRDYARDVLRLPYAISAIFRRTSARGASPNGSACEPPAKWKWSVSRGIATCGRSRQAVRLGCSRHPRNRRGRYRRAR